MKSTTFSEIPAHGNYPNIDCLPLLMQESIHKLSKLSSVNKIDAFEKTKTIRLNIFLKPQNRQIRIDQLLSSLDNETITMNYLHIHGPGNKVTMHLQYKKQKHLNN